MSLLAANGFIEIWAHTRPAYLWVSRLLMLRPHLIKVLDHACCLPLFGHDYHLDGDVCLGLC